MSLAHTVSVQDCWDQVRKLKGRTLKTLAQNKPFDVLEVGKTWVGISPHAHGNNCVLQRKEIEGAYRELVMNKTITRIRIQEAYAHFFPAHVAAILAQLPNVKYRVKPVIELWIEE